MSSTTGPKVLFLTTNPPSHIRAQLSNFPNHMLPDRLKEKGALVTVKCWMDEDIIETVDHHDIVTFLWCDEYHKHTAVFLAFLDMFESSFQSGGRGPLVINHIGLVRWNADKKYLLDMEKGGFDIPKTRLVDAEQYTVAELQARLREFQPSGPIVLKPAVSASANMTRCIADTSALAPDDIGFLELWVSGALPDNSLVIQEFEPSISTGEYSFIFIDQYLSHVITKVPERGEFRCQEEYGGLSTRVNTREIDGRTSNAVHSVFESLGRRFAVGSTGIIGYVRIDGLVTADRPFILMEIEAIEPDLYLQTGGGLDELLSLFFS